MERVKKTHKISSIFPSDVYIFLICHRRDRSVCDDRITFVKYLITMSNTIKFKNSRSKGVADDLSVATSSVLFK